MSTFCCGPLQCLVHQGTGTNPFESRRVLFCMAWVILSWPADFSCLFKSLTPWRWQLISFWHTLLRKLYAGSKTQTGSPIAIGDYIPDPITSYTIGSLLAGGVLWQKTLNQNYDTSLCNTWLYLVYKLPMWDDCPFTVQSSWVGNCRVPQCQTNMTKRRVGLCGWQDAQHQITGSMCESLRFA